jgi:hypothetical protein
MKELDEIKSRLEDLRTDGAKAAMWRTADVARLTAAVDAALRECAYLDTLAGGDKYYAKIFRTILERALKERS